MERIDTKAALTAMTRPLKKQGQNSASHVNQTKLDRIMKALTLLAKLQKHDLSSDQLTTFAGMLMGYPIDDIRIVVNDWCHNNKWFPTPSEIIGAINDRIKMRQRNTIQIPDNLRSFEEQAEINSRGIAAVRAVLAKANHEDD